MQSRRGRNIQRVRVLSTAWWYSQRQTSCKSKGFPHFRRCHSSWPNHLRISSNSRNPLAAGLLPLMYRLYCHNSIVQNIRCPCLNQNRKSGLWYHTAAHQFTTHAYLYPREAQEEIHSLLVRVLTLYVYEDRVLVVPSVKQPT